MASKIFEKFLCKQITTFIDPLPSKYQFGFRKGFSAQHCLLAMLEKWKNAVDKGKVFGALLTDLSKAFDCLPHELSYSYPTATTTNNNNLCFKNSVGNLNAD